MMKLDSEGEDLIKSFEALRLNAYLDSKGIPTIGWGHIKDVTIGITITEEQAEEYFQADSIETEKYISDLIKVDISQNQFNALVSLVFNIGIGHFKTSSVLKYLNEGNYQQAAESFLMWDKGTINGELVVIPGLENRRLKEKELFLKV